MVFLFVTDTTPAGQSMCRLCSIFNTYARWWRLQRERKKEPGARIQDPGGCFVDASAERRGYDSLILFKEITKLTKGDSYLCDLCDSRLDAVQIPGASRLSERGSYNGYRRRLEQELKHGMRRPSGSRRPRKRGSAPRFPPITNHFSWSHLDP